MKQFIIVSLVFALLVCSLFAEKEFTESDRKFLCAFKCWKQQRKNSKSGLNDCLETCKESQTTEESDVAAEPEAEVVAESDQGAGLIDEQKLWDQFRTVMLNALTQGQDKPYLQLLTTPIAAQWDTSDPTQLKRVSNHVPYWGEYYQQTPFKIDEQYCSFLKNIKTDDKIVDRDSKVMADQFENEIQQLGAQLASERARCTRDFIKLAKKPDFKQYMNDCLAASKLQDQIEEKKIMFQFFTSRAYGPEVGDILDARVDCETDTEWYEHSGSLAKFRADAKAGHARSLNVTIDSYTRVSHPRTWQQIAGGMKRPSSLNSSFFQFAIQSGTGYLTAVEQFNMQISFKGYGFVRSVPQKWFRHNVIKQFAAGPFYNSQPNLFGSNGTLRLKPTGFYLVYKPTMTITVARTDVQKFFGANLKSAGGMFSSSREEVKIDTTNTAADTAKISISSNSDDPLIVAIDNEILP